MKSTFATCELTYFVGNRNSSTSEIENFMEIEGYIKTRFYINASFNFDFCKLS